MVLPGTGAPEKCVGCRTKDQIRWMLQALPDPGTCAFEKLSEFEQKFVPSIRDQFARRGGLSEKQYEILERIYNERN